MNLRRKDTVKAAIVQASLLMKGSLGKVYCMEFLCKEKVPPYVIERVLENGPRRNSNHYDRD